MSKKDILPNQFFYTYVASELHGKAIDGADAVSDKQQSVKATSRSIQPTIS